MSARVFCFDASSHLHADWHATPAGNVPAAYQVFVNRVQAVRQKYRPYETIVCFDSHGPTFRHEIDPQYKQYRSAQDPDLAAQIQDARKHLERLGVICLSEDGFEADDLIATAAKRALLKGLKFVAVSKDKDLRQIIVKGRACVMHKTSMLAGEVYGQVLNWEGCIREYGVRPDQWIDFQCLVGDSSDGITGVRGIGKKIAARLLSEFGSVPGLFQNIWGAELTPRLRDAVIKFRGRYPVVRQLVALRTDLPLPKLF